MKMTLTLNQIGRFVFFRMTIAFFQAPLQVTGSQDRTVFPRTMMWQFCSHRTWFYSHCTNELVTLPDGISTAITCNTTEQSPWYPEPFLAFLFRCSVLKAFWASFTRFVESLIQIRPDASKGKRLQNVEDNEIYYITDLPLRLNLTPLF